MKKLQPFNYKHKTHNNRNPNVKLRKKVKRNTKQILKKGSDYMDEKCCVFQKIN